MTTPHSKSAAGPGEPLCCCEYENAAGDRSHILACCCDCQALDEACDRVVTCHAVSPSTLQSLWSTLGDRCRLPWVSGRGAVRVRLDVVTPVLVVPCCLLLASLGPRASVLAFLLMPTFLVLFYQVWRRQGQGRTSFFFAWGLSSVVTCCVVFQSLVVSFREVLLWEGLLQASLTAAMLAMLYRTKSDPGILRSGERGRLGRSSAVSPLPTGATPLYDHATGRLVQEGRPLYDQSADTTVQLDTELNAADVSWVDSRPVRDGKLVSWCSSCSFKRPPRAGHCPVCDACIAVRDHHCVWIDHCIGAKNHRSFLATMVLFVWCGLYGCHLTFTSICTPVMVYDWFLLPNDCRFLYQNFYTSMSFVCGVYSLAACGLVAVAVLYQLVLISQNVTSQELHAALTRRPVTCGLCPSHNLHHQGVLRNWLDFLLLPARHASSKIPS